MERDTRFLFLYQSGQLKDFYLFLLIYCFLSIIAKKMLHQRRRIFWERSMWDPNQTCRRVTFEVEEMSMRRDQNTESIKIETVGIFFITYLLLVLSSLVCLVTNRLWDVRNRWTRPNLLKQSSFRRSSRVILYLCVIRTRKRDFVNKSVTFLLSGFFLYYSDFIDFLIMFL